MKDYKFKITHKNGESKIVICDKFSIGEVNEIYKFYDKHKDYKVEVIS